MKQAENYKDVVINDRTFRIKKFNALTGGFMLIKIAVILAPFLKVLDLSKFKDVKKLSDVDLTALNLPGIIADLGKLSEEDFNYVQIKCLQICSEMMPAGLIPVLNDSGFFGVIGLEEDTMAVLALTVHTLIFNVKGFFHGSPLASLVGGLLTTSPQD